MRLSTYEKKWCFGGFLQTVGFNAICFCPIEIREIKTSFGSLVISKVYCLAMLQSRISD